MMSRLGWDTKATEQAMMFARHPGQASDKMSADNKTKYQIPGLENSISKKGM